MTQQATLTVQLSGTLNEFVQANIGENGRYETVSAYVSDLIRHDKERIEHAAFDYLKTELARAFSAPDASFQMLTAAEVIARNRG